MAKNRKWLVAVVLTLALIVGVIAVSAQAPSGSGWWVGFTIQNASPGNDITVASTAYHRTDSSTSTTYNSSVVVPDGGAVTFNPGLSSNCVAPPTVASNGCRIGFSSDLPAGFEGSVVISSDGPAVAIAQVNNNPVGSVGTSAGTARAGYQGSSGSIADTTLYFPTVKNNFAGQSTAFFVQAAGTDASVTITYVMNDGSSFTQDQDIVANKMFVFVPSAAGVPSCSGATGSTCIGGATVTSTTGPVAGTVVEYQEGASVAEFVLSTRGLTPSDTGATIIAPTMKNNFFGGTTGASIFNTGSGEATVDLDFTVTGATSGCSASAGDTASATVTVPAGGSTVVSAFRGNIGGLPNCTFFAMKASTAAHGGENIAVTVNESRSSGGNTFKAVYTGFNTANATDTVFFPLVKENFFNNTTGLAIVNASDSASTTVDVTYAGATGTHVLRTISLDPGEAVSLRQAFNGSPNYSAISGGLPSATNKYSVSAVANGAGAVIVGLAQEATISGTALDVYNLEGFNQ